MDTAFHDLAIQSVQTLRRAAERSARGLRGVAQNGGVENGRREAMQEFLADCRADLASLQSFRKTTDDLLCDGIEAETLLHLCEIAVEAASSTMQVMAVVATAHPSLFDAEPRASDIQVTSEQVQAIHAYFRRLAERLRMPLQPPAPTVLEKLESLPPVADPDANGRRSYTDAAGV